jgi:hypothetical protein
MANYAIRSQKRDAKGKGKFGTSGPPPSPAPVPAPIPVVPTGIRISDAVPAKGASPVKKFVPPSSGAEVANVQPKRRRLTKSGMLLSFGICSCVGTVCYFLIILFSSICR